jgi:methyl-accepting chemotaxis protein
MGDQAPRKIIFIDRKFQTGFILKFLGLLIVGTAAFDVAAYFILNRRLEESLYNAHMTIKSVGEILLPSLVSLSVIFVVLLGIAVLLMTLFVSHLIAGPLYAIRRYIERIGGGELDFDPRLRSKDQTTPLAMSLSESLEMLNRRLSAIQALGADILQTSGELKESVQEQSGENSAKFGENASRIEELASKLTEEAGFFKTRTGDPRP